MRAWITVQQWLVLIHFVYALDDAATSSGTNISSSTQAGSVSSTSSSNYGASSATATSSVATDSLSGNVTLTSAASGSSTQAQVNIPIKPTTFSPFPVPSDNPSPNYPAVDPSQPPSVDSSELPDFEPAWADAYAKAKAKIAGLTWDEIVNITTGVGWMNGRCVGNIPPISPIHGRGWPGLCLEDAPLGVRFSDFVSAFPTGINTAASFNRGLMRTRGLFMGREHRGKGVNVALGPMMNMGRVAQGGRNWEGFGADPYLAGEAAYETILGMQQGGVISCAKHLIGNEQEHNRTQESSNIDDRTLHEIYAHPFLKSIMAGVGSIMCSYNLLNGTYACENDKLMNDIIKREFGFQGFIMSDWSAQHSTMSAATGLDMTMPGDITFGSGTTYFGSNLTAYVNNGTIPKARVEDMATRILAAWYLLGQDSPEYPPTNFNAFNPLEDATNEHIDVQENHDTLIRELGAASVVLLKNERCALPLGKKERTIALIGSDAGPGKAGPNGFADQGGLDGILAMGWGSGTAYFTYKVTPLDAIQTKAREFHTSIDYILDDFDLLRAGLMAVKHSAALVFVSANSGEGYISVSGNEGDRNNLTAWHGGDALVLAVAALNNNTIVIVNSVGPLIIEPWVDHPNVTAVVWAGLSGSEVGNSLTDVLYGDWIPSGRLPYTIAKSPLDYPAQVVIGGKPGEILSIPYTEGLYIDYRHFDAKNITPRFEFGFGLSYTTFEYSDLSIQAIEDDDDPADAASVLAWENGEATPIAQGSSRAFWLHKPAYTVSFNVENSGPVFGGEIPQLYVNFPPSSGEPPSVLKGFTNIELSPGDENSVDITLSRYDLSIWDVVKQGWRRPEGRIGITIGASSRDARLKGYLPY